ncbi:hybrid sensor histidine kinase/response regulator transcription factor [Arcicella rosea]|uniref:hybrid sensor histidine kinase/response regulator transcription factor n=1 Tax=Arcicella rosea TaxID=502909 RepID=UPI00345CD1B0
MRFYFKLILVLTITQIQSISYPYAQKIHFSYLTTKDGLSQNRVRTIIKDKYGFMWFGTWNGLCRYDGYSFKVYKNIPNDNHSIASNRIHYLYKDSNGDLWIETFRSVICRYQYETDNFIRFKPAQLPRAIRDSVNRQQNLAKINSLATELQQKIGLFELSQTKENIVFKVNPNNEGGINDNNVNCVYKDNEGILWLGTTTGGVNKAELNAKPFHTHTLETDLHSTAQTSVRAILADSSGIWLGTQDKGVIFFDRKTYTRKTVTGLVSGKNVRALLKDSRGDLWIGSRTRLDKYSPRTKKTTSYFQQNGASFTRFFAIAEDPLDQSIWLATINGILRYDPKTSTFQKQKLNHSFSSSGAGCLFFDSQKNLWIGSEYAGLIKVKRNLRTRQIAEIQIYNSEGENPKLPDNRVYGITEDEKGNIWAGTANGLAKIDSKNHITLFGQQQGLADTYIAKVQADQQGFIWIGHKLGLSRLNIASGVIRNYTIKENTPRFEFTDATGCRDNKNGELFFGSTEGFVSFLPTEISDNTQLPKVYFTGLEVQNKAVVQGEKINERVLLTSPITLTKQLRFIHDDHSFSIEFAALQYIAPDRCQYAYKLEGIDADWVVSDARKRVASYSNLPDGKYRLLVKASNSDGIWNPEPATLEIIVLPPWWHTWWAYGIYALLFIFLIYGIYRIVQTRQAYHQKIFQAKIQAEKAIEMDELKSRFFTNISHEFRTPLSLIIDPLDYLMSGKNLAGKEKTYYQIIHRNASRLLQLINELLAFRKLESGTRQLAIQHQDIVLFIRQLLSAFELRAEKRQIKLHFESENESLFMGFDAEVLSTILYNLVSNALKFSGEKGEIWIRLHAQSPQMNDVSISVKDNGSGIPANMIDRIFDPFVQADNHVQKSLEGTGLGLALTKELVELHQGNISVSSEPFIATCFTFTLKGFDENTAQEFSQIAEYSNDKIETIAFEETQNTSSEVILLVEDNDDIRTYLKSILQNTYQVYEASNGIEGFEKAKEIVPDIIITDVMMPQESGIELCGKIKNDERTSHIPVIVLTARQSQESQIESYDIGADAFIPKPFSSELLQSRIQNLLNSRKKLRELFGLSTGFDHKIIGTNATDKLFVTKVYHLIESNLLDTNLNVEWLADQLSLSRTQLYRKIKALTNQSVHDFITTIRLKKASEYLQENHTVAEISYMVGYSDPTTFSRAFQKQFGQTPKKYSQNSKQ